jgi:hypothetical protein
MQPAVDTQQTREISLRPRVYAYQGRLSDLKLGATYEFEVVARGRPAEVLESGLFATERFIPPSVKGHVVDGLFTCQGADHEWADVEPVKGRYAYLYADFDGVSLHLMNDWHLCREPISEWDYNKFQVRTWPADDADRRRAIQWLIRVYPNGKVAVDLNGEDASIFVCGAHAHGLSPLVPDTMHSRYELSLDILGANLAQSDEVPEDGWEWEMEWLDPLAGSPNRAAAASALVQEPVSVAGTLLPTGGMTIVAHWAPPPPPCKGGALGTSVRCEGDSAEITVTCLGSSPTDLVCRMREVTLPAPQTTSETATPATLPDPRQAELDAWEEQYRERLRQDPKRDTVANPRDLTQGRSMSM